jgi:hypothetical protein
VVFTIIVITQEHKNIIIIILTILLLLLKDTKKNSIGNMLKTLLEIFAQQIWPLI